jgi:hypothetical protein
VASTCGRQQHARPLPAIDGLLAATAQTYGMTLVTRNVKDFERSGAWVLNPFTAWPGPAGSSEGLDAQVSEARER